MKYFQKYFQWKTRPLVGIDIGSSFIKLLEITKENGVYLVQRFATELLPPHAIAEKNLKNTPAVIQAIQHARQKAESTAPFASIAVSGSSVVLKTIQMNIAFQDQEIMEQIEFEAERYLPYSLEEVYFDFEVLGPSAKNPELIDIVLAAARIDGVDARLDVVTKAGLSTRMVDLEPLAIERAFEQIAQTLPSKGVGQNSAIMDIGAASATLYVLQEKRMIYMREQPFGGKQLTDEIQRRYGLSFEESFTAIKKGGLPDDYLSEVLLPFKEMVVQQINRALQFFFSSPEHADINYLILSGGIAAIEGIEGFIQEKIKIKTLIANPFTQMELAPTIDRIAFEREAPALMVCCGLALRNIDA